MQETVTWESTFFLRELWLKWSWPQCKHMSERWLTISLYNSLSTHPGSANSCPCYSQKVSEISLSEYSTISSNISHRPWASRSGAGERGTSSFPARVRGPDTREDVQSACFALPLISRDVGRFCLQKQPRTFSPQATLAPHFYLRKFTTLTGRHLTIAQNKYMHNT